MADKELNIVVVGDIDDITAKLDSLLDQLNLLQDQTLDLTVNADTSALSDASAASETLSEDLESAGDVANEVQQTAWLPVP